MSLREDITLNLILMPCQLNINLVSLTESYLKNDWFLAVLIKEILMIHLKIFPYNWMLNIVMETKPGAK